MRPPQRTCEWSIFSYLFDEVYKSGFALYIFHSGLALILTHSADPCVQQAMLSYWYRWIVLPVLVLVALVVSAWKTAKRVVRDREHFAVRKRNFLEEHDVSRRSANIDQKNENVHESKQHGTGLDDDETVVRVPNREEKERSETHKDKPIVATPRSSSKKLVLTSPVDKQHQTIIAISSGEVSRPISLGNQNDRGNHGSRRDPFSDDLDEADAEASKRFSDVIATRL